MKMVSIDDRIYHDIGIVNGKRVFMVQSEMGSGGLGASQQTVQKGILALSPVAVIMVGIAFGINPNKHSRGDVLVSQQLMLYDLQRVGEKEGDLKIILRGDKPHASPRLLNYFRSADLGWDESNRRIIFGLVLSGEKLVDNIDFRQQLYDLCPEAIGGEMEGAGLYAACQDYKVDWILVKSICDWADGNKARNKNKWQQLAANNAASFVLHMLQQVPFVGKSKEYESIPALVEDATNDIYKIRQTEEAKNNAKVIDMHLAKYSAPEFQKIAELYKKENQSTEKTNFYPLYPLYLPNDIDFVVKCDITKFDYDLSSAIYNFYSDLRKAEDCRLYIEENCINQDTRIQTLCVIKFQDMKSTIISCSNKISDIRSQLKEICNYSASPKPVG